MSRYDGTDAADLENGNYEEMYGWGGDDELITVWEGQVTLTGGTGNDYLFLFPHTNTWGLLSGDDGNDCIIGGRTMYSDTLLGGDGDDIVLGGDADDDGTDSIDGGAGRDALYGCVGDDTIVGGLGDDSGGSLFFFAKNWRYELTAGLFGQRGNDFLDGGSGRDLLDGGADNDTLHGGTGEDTLRGSFGDDVYFVDSVGDVVEERSGRGVDTVHATLSYTLTADVENLVLEGAAQSGTGNGQANRITGTAGGNTLDGGGGADTLEGGAGDDTYVVDSSADAVVEAAGGGADIVLASSDFTLAAEVENLTLTGSAVRGTGNGGANRITGTAGANTLDGSAGADTLIGGAGNDTYVVDGLDTLVEGTSGGIDTVLSASDFTLAAEFENLTLTGTALRGTGNAAANTLQGNAAANTLSGLDGNDLLQGLSGKDALSGGSGNDRLVGGSGQDKLSGGKGRDSFVFDDKDTSSSRTKADYISDFSGKSGDRLNLKLVDANSARKGDQGFSFIGEAEGFTKAGQVRYEKEGKYTYVYLNTDADQAAEAVIKLKGSLDLQKGWFVL